MCVTVISGRASQDLCGISRSAGWLLPLTHHLTRTKSISEVGPHSQAVRPCTWHAALTHQHRKLLILAEKHTRLHLCVYVRVRVRVRGCVCRETQLCAEHFGVEISISFALRSAFFSLERCPTHSAISHHLSFVAEASFLPQTTSFLLVFCSSAVARILSTARSRISSLAAQLTTRTMSSQAV